MNQAATLKLTEDDGSVLGFRHYINQQAESLHPLPIVEHWSGFVVGFSP